MTISRLPVCNDCIEAMRPIDQHVCHICGEALFWTAAAEELDAYGNICGECLRGRPHFECAAAYGSYSGGLRELIHLLKYEQVRPAAKVLGRMLSDVIAGLTEFFGGEWPVIIPVPLHATKQRQRGFNQSELIAAAAIRCGEWTEARLIPQALVRVRATESQIGLTRAQRRDNMRGAFRVEHANEISGRDVLVVDDVFTTGTTVGECARVLRKAGAQRVWVATVARVLKPESAAATEQDDEAEVGLALGAHAG